MDYEPDYEDDPIVKPVGKDFWDAYITQFKPRTKARTLLQEQIEPYLPYIVWDNKTFTRDMAVFWMAVNRHSKTNPSGSTVRIMEWVKKLNSLHPMQVVKALNAKKTKKSIHL